MPNSIRFQVKQINNFFVVHQQKERSIENLFNKMSRIYSVDDLLKKENKKISFIDEKKNIIDANHQNRCLFKEQLKFSKLEEPLSLGIPITGNQCSIIHKNFFFFLVNCRFEKL